METLVEDEAPWEDHFDVSEYGPVRVVLNKILHLDVLICTLLGLARLDVKFKCTVDMVRRISYVLIVHSWYLTLKMALITTLIYLFNENLDAESRVSLMKFNCSQLNQLNFFDLPELIGAQTNTTAESPQQGFYLSRLTRTYQEIGKGDHWTTSDVVYAALRGDSGWKPSITLLIADAIDTIGCPYSLLGNRATLMYGYYAFTIYHALAMFPTAIYFLNLRFNYIRFVLNDAGCLRDLYQKKCWHQQRLSDWSRSVSISMLSWCMKRTANQRDLRCYHIRHGCERLLHDLQLGAFIDNLEPREVDSSRRNSLARLLFASEHEMFSPLKLPRHSLPTSQHHRPSRNVRVADKNLAKFTPFVRSESSFKMAMTFYPVLLLMFAFSLTMVVGSLTVFFNSELQQFSGTCTEELKRNIDLLSNWTHLEILTYIEMQYSILTIGISFAFYIFYYFGTILELNIWVQELAQQLDLCILVLELTHNDCSDLPSTLKSETKYRTEQRANQSDTPAQYPTVDTQPAHGHNTLGDECVNQFGGLKSVQALVRFHCLTQSQKLKCRELAAINLIPHQQSLLRAIYVNLNLFFDELNATRLAVKLILTSAIQIVFGCALLIGLTKSQFEYSYLLLVCLMALTFVIVNIELMCAANLNTEMNKLLPQIHSLICSLIAFDSDPDLLEFWQRHILGYGNDHDAMSYRIYHHKITWESITSFDGAIASAFLFNIY